MRLCNEKLVLQGDGEDERVEGDELGRPVVGKIVAKNLGNTLKVGIVIPPVARLGSEKCQLVGSIWMIWFNVQHCLVRRHRLCGPLKLAQSVGVVQQGVDAVWHQFFCLLQVGQRRFLLPLSKVDSTRRLVTLAKLWVDLHRLKKGGHRAVVVSVCHVVVPQVVPSNLRPRCKRRRFLVRRHRLGLVPCRLPRLSDHCHEVGGVGFGGRRKGTSELLGCLLAASRAAEELEELAMHLMTVWKGSDGLAEALGRFIHA
mmetsp:Transcript_44463/g.111394  ORF Transcript_44463/g.111394 Transcript_44463/m.111394 type:complete len:257 (+) Transcript_44463:1310-2080(+)